MDIFRATREAANNLEVLADVLKIIKKDVFHSQYRMRDIRILDSVIKRLTIQKETLHRFRYEEDEVTDDLGNN
jgi:hypothetical protein|tara:strand:+ start:244 stop:462 length:219 start_codon:yes stop_codon:yes gene_type:complete